MIGEIADFCAGNDLLTFAEIRAALARELDTVDNGALTLLKARLGADEGWTYYPPDSLARRVHYLLADRFLRPESELIGAGNAAPMLGEPVVLVANHLSYADANVIQVLLQRGGQSALAERLTAVAGPKVFTSRQRRFSSLCFGTVKVPQSADLASAEAALHPRAVAQAARCSIDAARGRLVAGDALLLFAEGTRSRSGAMQPMLAGAARYLELPGTWVLPVGVFGSEALFPVDSGTLRPARATVQLGEPVAAARLFTGADGDRRAVMDAIGLAVAGLLPPEYRGVYADADRFAAGKDLLRKLR